MARALVSKVLSLGSNLAAAIRTSSSTSADPRAKFQREMHQFLSILSTIDAVTIDAEGKEVKDSSVKLWLKELKEVAYDAEDVVDLYRCEVVRANAELDRASSSSPSRKRKRAMQDLEEEVSGPTATAPLSAADVSVLVGLTERMKVIRVRFEEISRAREDLRLREEYGGGRRGLDRSETRKPPLPVGGASVVFGRDDDKESIVQSLLEEDGKQANSVSVMPIVGIGGLGKTTVARLVFDDPRVCRRFSRKAWVSASVDFDAAKLTRSAIESITERPCDLEEESQLEDTLRGVLEGKTALLVLDNVWSDERSDWERFRAPFAAAERAWILVTTRNTSVAEMMQTEPYYPLGYLNEEESWGLFKHYAFCGRSDDEQENLTDVCKEIAKKCGGLPLALKTIGGLLQYETSEENWEEVLHSDLWELDLEEDSEVINALKISYNRMPAYLKPCYLFCSTFPKGFEFLREKLVALWMAQGYIHPEGKKRLEDIGSEYLDELHCRSFFDSFSDSRCTMFTMHDSIHDLAQYISDNEHRAVLDLKLCDISDDVHHLYVDGNENLVESLKIRKPVAKRTFILYSKIAKFPATLQNMVSLRTLELYCRVINELPNSIGDLKQLRHFTVTSRNIRKLPESICQLYNLQILSLISCENLENLPKQIGNLTNLKYLRLTSNHVIKSLPESICQLQNLESLDLSSCKRIKALPSQIGTLTNLYKLEISGSSIEWMSTVIGKLVKLEKFSAKLKIKKEDTGLLKDLAKLSGKLCLLGLQNIANVEQIKKINIKDKHQLRRLTLVWEDDFNKCYDEADVFSADHLDLIIKSVKCPKTKGTAADKNIVEAILTSLQPHNNISELFIGSYDGKKFPTWIGDTSFSNLTTINISRCSSASFPTLGLLPSLQSLTLEEFPNVKSIDCDFLRRNDKENSETPSATVAFPSLRDLEIEDMPKLERWNGIQNQDFPCLVELTLEECPRLKELPVFPSVKSLFLSGCGKMRSLSLHQNIETLSVKDCENLRLMPSLCDLTSIKSLYLAGCPKLDISTDNNLPCVPELVTVVDCQELQDWSYKQGYDFYQGISELTQLTVSDIQSITKPGPDRFDSLENLCIQNCSDLPPMIEDWLPARVEKLEFRSCTFVGDLYLEGDLHMISDLVISGCTKLQNLLYIHALVCLEVLHIQSCPLLNLIEDEILPSTLIHFVVESCPKLTGLPFIHEGLSELATLKVADCPKLKTISGIKNLSTNLKALTIQDCPGLEVSSEDQLQHTPEVLEISNCPAMADWCQRRNTYLHG